MSNRLDLPLGNWTIQNENFLIKSEAGLKRKDHEDVQISEQQIAVILKQVDNELSVEEICRKAAARLNRPNTGGARSTAA